MLAHCVTITDNIPDKILSCINSILTQTYTNIRYELYVVTSVDSEELIYNDLLKDYVKNANFSIFYIPNKIVYTNIKQIPDSIFVEIDISNIYNNNFIQGIIDDFSSCQLDAIHYMPKFYINNGILVKNNDKKSTVTAYKANKDCSSIDLKYSGYFIASDNILKQERYASIDNKYCGIFYFNHPSWQSYVYLNKRNNRLFNINNNDHGMYSHIGNDKIKIVWDKHGEEIFQRIDNETSIVYNAS
jgi:hypothetical protein